jgi:hypothetical protein
MEKERQAGGKAGGEQLRPVPRQRGAVVAKADRRHYWVLAGLFLTTLATLSLELLDTRLLSVLTWYHLSFFAISMAMFGMAAGAIQVYLGGGRYEGENAMRELCAASLWFAVAIAVTHVFNLMIPFELDRSLTSLSAIAVSMTLVAVPFYFSGIVVTLVLTRLPGRIGLTYSTDLIGASLGSILVIPLLRLGNISSATFAVAAIGALGAACFRKSAGVPIQRQYTLSLGAALLVLAFINGLTIHGFRVMFSKGHEQTAWGLRYEAWNSYSQVIEEEPVRAAPFYWGRGKGAPTAPVTRANLFIDGKAGTVMTQWDGNPANLSWTAFDVSALAYHLRKNGEVGIIGVGGGRDVLTALWAHSRSVTGIEMNEILIHLLRGPMRDFAAIASQPQVELINDEARSYLTRSNKRFDILQMSLIDTWAATGAGAYTLSENGLYTIEAWRVFLRALKPGGIFTVSRFYSPRHASETTRLLALATAALLDRGISNPAEHIALVFCSRHTRGPVGVATLLVSDEALTAGDLKTLADTARRYGFTVLLAPGSPPAYPLLGAIASSRSRNQLMKAIRNVAYDYRPPTDDRPYFFNILKPRGLLRVILQSGRGGAVKGNLLATATLLVLTAIAIALVASMILLPLWRSGLPDMKGGDFASGVAYFSLIGFGFMMVQIPYMQRFSVYLGYPTYAIAVILFSMILFAGIGSLVSDAAPIESHPVWIYAIVLTIALAILAVTASLQNVINATIHLSILPRCLIVVALTFPVAFFMGFCFPIGMRLVARLSDEALPWMWGINGAWGVFGSIAAVGFSMWAGIHESLYLAAACYAALVIPATRLLRRQNESADTAELDAPTASARTIAD